MAKNKFLILWTVLPLIILGISARWIIHSFEEPKGEPLKTTVMLRDIRQVVRGFGYLEAEKVHSIRADLPGRLKKIKVQAGERVKKKGPLFEIENRDFKKDYELTKAQYGQAQSELNKMLLKPDEATLFETKGSLEKAERLEEELTRELKGKLELYEKGFVSKSDTKELEGRLQSARVEKRIASKRFEEASKPAPLEEVKLKRAEVSKMEAQVLSLKKQWKARERSTPFHAWVLEVLKKEGDEVTAEDSVLVLINTQEPFVIQGMVYESEVGKLFKGQKALVKLTGTSQMLEAVVADISLVAKASGNSRKFPVKLLIRDKIEGSLRIGIGADYEILIGTKNNVLALPLQFIVHQDEVAGTWVIRDGKREFIPLNLGLRDDTFVEIVGGLKRGEEVALSGEETL